MKKKRHSPVCFRQRRHTWRGITGVVVLLLAGPALADSNSDYRAGSDFAHQIQGQGTGSIQNFRPQDSIPGYNANPDETKYYGGVTAGGDSGLKNDGTTQWATGETGKTITESFMNKPKDILSPDAPFIEKGRDVVNRADSIVGNTGQQCSAQDINRSEFTNYTCERDTTVEEYCTRTSTITGDWRETSEVRTYTLTAFSFSRSGKQIVFSVTVPEAGTISSASLNVTTQNYLWNSRAGFMNTTFNMTWSSTITLGGATGMMLSKGQVLSGTSCSGNGSCTGSVDDRIFNELTSGRTRLTLTLVMQVKDREWIPRVEWVESCPFNKVDGVLKDTECTEPGGTKTGVMEGNPGASHSHAGHTAINMSRSRQITAPARRMSIIRPVLLPPGSARFTPVRVPACMNTPRTPVSRKPPERS